MTSMWEGSCSSIFWEVLGSRYWSNTWMSWRCGIDGEDIPWIGGIFCSLVLIVVIGCLNNSKSSKSFSFSFGKYFAFEACKSSLKKTSLEIRIC